MMGFTAYLFDINILFSSTHQQPRSEKYETKLDILNKQLQNFRNFLSSTEKRSTEAEILLRSSEKELNTLINNIEEQKKSIKNSKSKITQLEKEREMLLSLIHI